MYLTRRIEPVLKEYLSGFPAVALTGPRQSGKSTLLQHVLPEYEYVSFDNPQTILLFEDDPEAFIGRYSDKVIFDEVQKMPEIFHYIKIAIDQDRQNYGKFVLTGSAQFSLVKSITETLAGRIGMLTLLPFQFSELPVELQDNAIIYGAYPELVSRGYRMKDAWYGSYVDTYVERDVRYIQNIGDLRDFRRLLNLLAANVSQELNYSTYAHDLGVAVNTIKRWVSVLEASYIIFLLPPYYENFGKRLTKSPKIYFHDTGLVTYLTGIESVKQYEQGPMAGAIYENYIVSEIYKKIKHANESAALYYLRVHKSTEIDLIVDWKSYRHFIEIKKQTTFRPKMLKHISSLSENADFKQEDHGYLIYNGEDLEYMPKLTVMNYKHYLS